MKRLFSTASILAASSSSKPPIFVLKNSTIFPFGVPSNDPDQALFKSINWTIGHTDAWAVLSSSSSASVKKNLISTILSQTRCFPLGSSQHPILESLPKRLRMKEEGAELDRLTTVNDIIQLVSFKNRLTGGEFEDYTARYYSIRDSDKLTLRQHLIQSLPYFGDEHLRGDLILEAAKSLEMQDFLELPIVTLSNGQTRRARLLKALLARPELIILEEPFTGLDVSSRNVLTSLLTKLHSKQSPRVLLVLRPQDPFPEFITHIALISKDPTTTKNEKHSLKFGKKEEILSSFEARELLEGGIKERELGEERKRLRIEEERKRVEVEEKEGKGRKNLVELNGVNVSYGPINVLIDINWTIKEGDRWILSGHNGSGKSTLLAMILGDHPRSFTEEIILFGKPRIKQATATIQQNVGHFSPEIWNSFPRKFGPTALTVKEAIVTGFNSIYSYRKTTPEQKEQLDSLLVELNHPLYTPSYLKLEFSSLPPGEQSLALLLRALVKRPPLLVLDEPFSFMTKDMVDFVKNYLDTGLRKDQAVIFISHFEEEIPQSMTQTLVLEHGKIIGKHLY